MMACMIWISPGLSSVGCRLPYPGWPLVSTTVSITHDVAHARDTPCRGCIISITNILTYCMT